VGELLQPRARVLAPDLPGFGDSAGLAVEPSLDAWADLLEGWLEAVSGSRPVVVCGLSMGGYLALRLAHRHPQRLAALVLADTHAGSDTDADRAGRDQRVALVGERGVSALLDTLLPRLVGPTAAPGVVAEIRRIAGEQTRDAVTSALAAMRDRPDSAPLLGKIRVPAAVVVGADDALTPPSTAERTCAALPDGRLRVIPDAGHLSALEAPKPFAEALLELLDGL
jgi:pimeloyl-ACP methyl ester carboxylesterase